MKEKTILSFIETLNKIKDSKLSISAYCEKNGLCKQSIYDKMHEFRRTMEHSTDHYNEVVELYNAITNPANETQYDKISVDKSEETQKPTSKENVDSENCTEVSYDRDEEGKIVYYNYKIYRKKKNPLIGKLSRDEMNIVYRLYSYYGASLTQREVSRYFNELSLVDFKRILSAFGIYKASAPFAPHIIEETPVDELRNMQLREKENDFLKKIEEDRIRNNEQLLKKYAVENADLKKQLDNVNNLTFEITNFPEIPVITSKIDSNNPDITLYLADMHVGAIVGSNSLYDENKNYGVEEIRRRLNALIGKICGLGKFNTINICLMGDMLDCCGPTNKTSRLDHELPENMDGFEQANAYISLIHEFVKSIINNMLCNKINMYSVKCGNHTGPIEYIATRALFAELSKNKMINTKLFSDFFGTFTTNGHTFVITHGKDEKYMKKGLPLNLDDKSKIKMYEWFDSQKIYGDNIHVVKGDLHSNAYNSCKKFDYRNVLSLFGASDYSAFNYSRNSYGVSYDLFINGNLIRGEFQNF